MDPWSNHGYAASLKFWSVEKVSLQEWETYCQQTAYGINKNTLPGEEEGRNTCKSVSALFDSDEDTRRVETWDLFRYFFFFPSDLSAPVYFLDSAFAKGSIVFIYFNGCVPGLWALPTTCVGGWSTRDSFISDKIKVLFMSTKLYTRCRNTQIQTSAYCALL